MLLDHPLISQRLFFPRRDAPADPFFVDSGVQLACWRRVRHPGTGFLLHFHGNGEVVAGYKGFADWVLDLGVNVCFVEYRGYGASAGTPALVAMLGDGERVLEALGVPQSKVVAFGRSLGSLYAAELAQRRPGLAGLVLESGIADVSELLRARVRAEELGCTAEELTAESSRSFDQRAKLGAYRGPLLVLHAERDNLLDRSHGERLHAWGGGTDKELVLFPHGNHNSILLANLDAYLRALASFLRRAGLEDEANLRKAVKGVDFAG
jgi:pimeloyl-ACP methyl ester carboxylesterase